MKECTVQINEATLSQKPRGAEEGPFKIGYMYGLNQYHKDNFLLRYSLTTSRMNTIAIYVDHYNPALFPTLGDKCQSHFLSISARKASNDLAPIFKLCDPADLKNETVRLFMVRAPALGAKRLSGIQVEYFSAEQALGKTELNDFRISYEFLEFDWGSHEAQSVCNFVYTAKSRR